MENNNETIESIAREIAKKDLSWYFIADRIRNAHNREMQQLRERVEKLEGVILDNGLEVE